MLFPTQLRINGGRITKETVVAQQNIHFSWALEGSGKQTAYALRFCRGGKTLWDTGWVTSNEQACTLDVPSLRSGFTYEVILQIRDDRGAETATEGNTFQMALLEPWDGLWICPEEDFGDGVIYFQKDFSVEEKPVENAVLYVCGLGYHQANINSQPITDHRMAPAMSDYTKRCYYETLDVSGLIKEGNNQLQIAVAQGWRRNLGPWHKHLGGRTIPFFGRPMLTAILAITYTDGTQTRLITDRSWLCQKGKIVASHLFDGETFDARVEDLPLIPCVLTEKPHPDTILRPDLLEPIRVKKVYEPISIHRFEDGYIFDLGKNIAGVAEITVPKDLPEGTEIRLQHAEVLDGNGDLYTAPLRDVSATDVYIVGKKNPACWSPMFTYHGFRYVKVTGLPYRPSRNFLRGLQFYTDIDNHSFFTCGSPIVNQLQALILQTERDNIHALATDCHQRDERMGWLNDTTVRFEEMPYNFDVGRLFPKILGDIQDAQVDGMLTCTAPYFYGNRPADPVSSSFLMAAYECYLHYGNIQPLAQAYPAMCAWNAYLESISPEGITSVSYYGDWASPSDCCAGCADSAMTPGIFMSTGYHYLNSKLLAFFAKILGKTEDIQAHEKRAAFVKEKMLEKWLQEDGRICTGSQACQAFALKLGILPENLRSAAAAIMNQAVIDAGMRITTGNLCTLYLVEMLTEYGYIDTAWELLIREEYPSWGHMMQHGATTLWERFERKSIPTMNSHCHPMYGAVGKWLYSHLVGITPLTAGYETVRIQPYMPTKLLSAQATVDTCRGDITVKWEKVDGQIHLLVDVPAGVTAQVLFAGEEHSLRGGTQVYTVKE